VSVRMPINEKIEQHLVAFSAAGHAKSGLKGLGSNCIGEAVASTVTRF